MTETVERRERSDVNGGRESYTRGAKALGYTCDTYAGKAMGKVHGERGRGGGRAARERPPDLRSRAKSVGGRGRRAIHPQSIYRVTA